jgi:glycosyltransferase involved in cell wall biosynthesis
VIPNGSDIRLRISRYDEPLKVIYGGNFVYYENIDSYLDLARINRTCAFYLAGGGPMKEHLLTRVRNEKIRVEYLGYLSYDECIDTFASMNIGIMPAAKTVNIEIAYPIKVFDYMSCGLPVITPDFGEWAKVVSRNKCGMVTRTSSAEEFDACLRSLNREMWQEMSANAVRVIREQFNWSILLRELDAIFKI